MFSGQSNPLTVAQEQADWGEEMEPLDERKQASAKLLGVDYGAIVTGGDNVYILDRRRKAWAKLLNISPEHIKIALRAPEYLVLTNKEADEAENELLDLFIENCILPEMPEHYRNFFMPERWKEAEKLKGRGKLLAIKDGIEHKVTIGGNDYYIYRIGETGQTYETT